MEHSFDIEVAEEYGIHEAIFIKHFQFWIVKNKANGIHQHDDRTWTYNSNKAFTKLFPYMSQKTIRTTLDHLKDKGVLITGNYNDNPHNRTLWYAFANEEKWICQFQRMDLPKSANASADNGKCINTDIDYTNNIPDNKPNNISPSIPQGDVIEEVSLEEQIFEDFRKVYLGTKRGCKVEFENFKKKHKDWKEVLLNLKPAYERQVEAKKSQRGSIDPRYEKHLQTYINQRCWEEEITYGSNTSTTTNHGHEAVSATDKARQRAIETLRANGYM